MNVISTNKKSKPVSFKEAVLLNMPEDKGLFLPEAIPFLDIESLKKLRGGSFAETAFFVLRTLLGDEIPDTDLKKICDQSFCFEMPLVSLSEQQRLYVLETFHGPTKAFKDVGVRFLAGLLQYYGVHDRLVLTATSGDTGAAVADAFHGVPGITVCILYPRGKISEIQEKQIAGFGKNIVALSVDADFDACQQIVKAACREPRVASRLISANSINIARLLAQVAYYVHTWALLMQRDDKEPFTVSVPSGNFGNATAALIAKRMGVPIRTIIAATNSNDVIPQYFKTGVMNNQPTKETLSTAMDIALPNNFERIQCLCGNALDNLKKEIHAVSIDDEATKAAIRALSKQYGYRCDPHGGVAYSAIKDSDAVGTKVFLATAHWAKFSDIVTEVLHAEADTPDWFEQVNQRTLHCKQITPHIEDLMQELQLIIGHEKISTTI